MSNFKFLQEKWQLLSELGKNAEHYIYADANISIIKSGLFGEKLTNIMFELDGLMTPKFDNTHANRIKLLKSEGMIPQEIEDILFMLRTNRNKAVHDGFGDVRQAKLLVELAFKLANWFMETYGDYTFVATDFVVPEEKPNSAEYEAMLQAQEQKINQLEGQIIDISQGKVVSKSERRQKAKEVAFKIKLSEKETRCLIDEQLAEAGWEADTNTLTYAKGTRPQKSRNLAIAEWPTTSKVAKRGYVDYALFVGLKLVGIIEAKKYQTDVSSVIDYQCKDYAKCIRQEDEDYIIDNWGECKVPFLFATNGRKYFKQLETKSGIWFLDARKSHNISQALQGFMSPDGIIELLDKDVDSANNKLETTSYDLLTDEDGLNLRDYQVKAIECIERAIIKQKDRVLISMATGTGKTRTLLGLIYRMIKSKRFSRVLFLVDRTALGEQTNDVFKEVKIEDLKTIDEIYDIKGLGEKDIQRETKIHVSTVQSLVKRIMYNESDNKPTVSDYDLIVIDEAHRGYILDKDMDEDEILYRNQDDYVSKYRMVIDYFNAVKVAVTATPALHTTQIFGLPVFSYSYREAVVNGYLVDHDAPHVIKTKLSTQGINYKEGDTVAIYDPSTGKIINSDELEDELKFDVEKFNKQVITENFNRTVLKEIANDINPEGDGKTLIFAANDAHADLIVKILKEIYADYQIDNEAILKITGSVGGGDKKRVMEAIKRFKNEKYPNIVVTVDLLTTGIDVPEIDTLVFMRRVKSRILFEQMIGRATRLCPQIGKSHFEIYDAVGLYESMQEVSTMKPIVTSVKTKFDDIIKGFETATNKEKQQNQVDMIVAKLRRKANNMNEEMLNEFKNSADGQTPSEFCDKLKEMSSAAAVKHIQDKKEIFDWLDNIVSGKSRKLIISDKEDELIDHSRGYGDGVAPEDYLNEFNQFIKNNMNKIIALNIICTKPSSLTREALKSLEIELGRYNFTEKQLNTAVSELKNEDIVADIISLVRQQAIGSALINHEDRIKNAFTKLTKNHKFSKIERRWIQRIETHMLNNHILNIETFEESAFKISGGFNKLDKIFNNKLEDIIQEVNDYLYDDRSVS